MRNKNLQSTTPDPSQHLFRTWGYDIPAGAVASFAGHIWPHFKWIAEELLPRLQNPEHLTYEEFKILSERMFDQVLREFPEHPATLEAAMLLIDKGTESIIHHGVKNREWSTLMLEIYVGGILNPSRNKAASKKHYGSMIEAFIPYAQMIKDEQKLSWLGQKLYGHDEPWIVEAFVAKHKNWND